MRRVVTDAQGDQIDRSGSLALPRTTHEPLSTSYSGLSRDPTQTLRSHLPVDNDIEQLGAGRGKGAPQRGGDSVGISNVLGRHAHGSGQRGEIDLGIGKVHADEPIIAVKRFEALLDDAIAAVVGDDISDRQLEVCGGPERLDGVHSTAVTGVAQYLPRRLGESDAYGSRHAPADAAGGERMEAVAIAIGDEIVEVTRGGEAFVHHHG